MKFFSTVAAVLLISLASTPLSHRLRAAGIDDVRTIRAPEPSADTDEDNGDLGDSGDVERLDSMGDPLPFRTVSRLGHNRFRHSDTVRHLILSPDGKLALSCTDSNTVYVWNAESGERLWRLSIPTSNANPELVAISPNNKYVAVSTANDAVYLFRLAERQTPYLIGERRSPRENRALGHFLAFSRDNKRVIHGSEQLVLAWDTDNGKEVLRQSFHYVIGYCPTTDQVAVHPGRPNCVEICSLATGRVEHRWTLTEAPDTKLVYHSAAFSPSGKLVALGAYRGVRVIETNTGRQRLAQDEIGFRRSLAFSEDDKWFVDVTDKGVRRSHLEKPDVRYPVLFDGPNFRAAVLGDGRKLLVADRTVLRLVETESGKHILPGVERDAPDSFRFSPDGTRVVSNEGIVFDVKSGKVLWHNKHPDSCDHATFASPTRVVMSLHNPILKTVEFKKDMWDVSAATITKKHLWAPSGAGISGTAFSCDGAWLLTDQHSLLTFVDTRTGKVKRTIDALRDIRFYEMAPDNQTVAIGVKRSGNSDDCTVLLTRVDLSDREYATPAPFVDLKLTNASYASFSPTGHHLLITTSLRTRLVAEAEVSRASLQVWEAATASRIAEFDLGIAQPGRVSIERSGTFAMLPLLLPYYQSVREPRTSSVASAIDLVNGRVLTPFTAPDPLTMSPDGKLLVVREGDGLAPVIVKLPDLRSHCIPQRDDTSPKDLWTALAKQPQEARRAMAQIAAMAEADLRHILDLHEADDQQATQMVGALERVLDRCDSKVERERTEAQAMFDAIIVRQPSLTRKAIMSRSDRVAAPLLARLDRMLASPTLSDVREVRRLRLIQALASNARPETKDALKRIAHVTPDSPAGKAATLVTGFVE